MTTLREKVQNAPPGEKGFDADTRISLEQAKLFYQSGFRFCLSLNCTRISNSPTIGVL